MQVVRVLGGRNKPDRDGLLYLSPELRDKPPAEDQDSRPECLSPRPRSECFSL